MPDPAWSRCRARAAFVVVVAVGVWGSKVAHPRSLFPLLLDDPAIVGVWEALVVAHDCKGKVAHDARIVAAMRTHGLREVLTFNTADFARFPGITAIDPATV